MIRELLIALRLRKPDIHDIINKIMKDEFNDEELNNLYKVGPFFYTTSDGHTIKIDYRTYYDHKYIIEFLYSSVYCLPHEKDIFKYLPEIKLAIQECKRQLPKRVEDYNMRRKECKDLAKKKEQCIMKLWKKLNE